MTWLLGRMIFYFGLILFTFALYKYGGPKVRKVMGVLLIFAMVNFFAQAVYIALNPEPELYDALIERESINLTIDSIPKDSFPLYGQNQTHYFVIYPALHWKIAKDANCEGLVQYDKNTYCGPAQIPQCNDGGDGCKISF